MRMNSALEPTVEQALWQEVVNKYLELLQADMSNGHELSTDFLNYAKLVETVVETSKSYDGCVFLTALCIPPFQWFNYRIQNPRAKSVAQTQRMEADLTWTNYINFAAKIGMTPGVELYRYVFRAEKKFEHRTYFKELLSEDIIDGQFNSWLIERVDQPRNSFQPLTGDELEIIFSKSNRTIPRCYRGVESAFLIVDKEPLYLDSKEYKSTRLIDVFARFQSGLRHWVYGPAFSVRSWLPEDFFIVGRKGSSVEWQFAIAADVQSDLKKVKLWFLKNNLTAKEMSNQGKESELFEFNDLRQFVTEIFEGKTR